MEYSQTIEEDDDELYPDEVEQHYEIVEECRKREKERQEMTPE